MPIIYIDIKTDDRVFDLIDKIKKIPEIKNLHHIDSANLGEGFRFLLEEVEVTFYDWMRSDAVMFDPDFKEGDHENNEKIFQKVKEEMKGEVKIECEIIDLEYLNKNDELAQKKEIAVRDKIINCLKDAGYNEIKVKEGD